jgi:hypothetical protein
MHMITIHFCLFLGISAGLQFSILFWLPNLSTYRFRYGLQFWLGMPGDPNHKVFPQCLICLLLGTILAVISKVAWWSFKISNDFSSTVIGRCLNSMKSSNDFWSDWQMFDFLEVIQWFQLWLADVWWSLKPSNDFSSDRQMFDEPWSHPVILALIGGCLTILEVIQWF